MSANLDVFLSARKAPFQISMPQDACGDGTPRSPSPCDLCRPPNRRPLSQSPQTLHRGQERNVSRRPDIGMTQRHQQINVGRPRSDPIHLLQLFTRLRRRRTREFSQAQVSGEDLVRKLTTIRGLLSRYAEPTQACDSTRSDGFCTDSPQMIFHTPVNRLRGCQRHLLFKDDADKRCRPGPSGPQRRRTMALNDGGKIAVHAR